MKGELVQIRTFLSRYNLLIVLLLSGVLGIVRFNDIPVGSFFDDAHYLVLAESLVEGRGYNLINYPQPIPENAFPPGWPLLLSLVTAVFGSSLFWPRLLAFVFWLASIPLVERLFARRFPPLLSILFLTLVVLNPHLIGMAGTAMSEASYIFFTLLTLVILQSWVDRPERRTVWQLLALGLVAFLAMLIRTIGIALVGAVVITLLLSLRRRQLRWLLPAGGIGVVGIALLVFFNQQSGGTLIFSQVYSDHLAYLLPRWMDFLRFWELGTAVSLETLANSVLPIFELGAINSLLSSSLMRLLATATLLLIALGFILRCRKMSAVEWYVLGYVLIFYVWTIYIETVQPRIAIPLIPFATFYLVTAVDQLAGWLLRGRWKSRRSQLVTYALLLLLVIHLGRNIYAGLNPVKQEIVDLSQGTTWIAANLPEEVVVMSPNPVPDYLYMRRLTVDYPSEVTQLIDQLHENSVDYILVRPNLTIGRQRYLDPRGAQLLTAVQSDSSQFKLVYQNQSALVWVYEVEKGS